jgi:beta-lactamase regulating signal transducer with metallopeptidase domain
MNGFLVDTPLPAVLWIALAASVILAAAALLQMLWRRRSSAATRHFAWIVVLAGLLSLPVARRIAPEWSVPVGVAAVGVQPAPVERRTDRVPVPDVPTSPATSVAVPAIHTPDVPSASTTAFIPATSALALAVYGAGVAGVFLFFGAQSWRIRRLASRAVPVADEEWTSLLDAAAAEVGVRRPVRLLRSRDTVIPMTFGTRTPSIVVPAIGDLWSEDRRRAVLLHELAHVARHDCLTQTIALAACAAYWPHPAVWWVARRLRIERELACDDRVLAAGAEPRAYAGHLLDIAYSRDGRQAPALAVSMARPSQLEGRLLAALDVARNRRRPGLGLRLALTAVAAAAVVALAGATPATETVNTGQLLDTESAGDPAFAAAPHAREAQAPDKVAPDLKPVDWAPMVAVRRVVEAVVAGVAEVAQEIVPGTWELRPSTKPGTVHLRLTEGQSSHGSDVALASLEGLTEAQLAGPGGPVKFQITRDAGTLQFEGVLRNGVAGGTFSFAANAAFPAELAKRGFAKPTAREQYQLARHDIGYAFLDELNRLGYAKPDTAGLVTAGQHGVNTTYLREMASLGYALGSLPPLITLRDHGVTPDYVRGMAQEGYKQLPADKIREARDHGVGPDYVKGMREAGYGSLPIDEIINARDHGVTPDYVRALTDAGHRGLPLDKVVRVRDHGVTPDYLEAMRQLGYTPSIDELVQARDHGVTPDYARGMAAAGYERTPLDRLIKARDHGVTPEYAKAVKALGYDNLSLDDLVTLRDHGLTADRIRSANARAGTRLPVDMLRSVAAGGGVR